MKYIYIYILVHYTTYTHDLAVSRCPPVTHKPLSFLNLTNGTPSAPSVASTASSMTSSERPKNCGLQVTMETFFDGWNSFFLCFPRRTKIMACYLD